MKDLDFYGFPKSSPEEWKNRVKVDLKGKDFEESLVSELWGRIKIDPMYFQGGNTVHQTIFHPKPEISGFSPRIWANTQAINATSEAEANTEILKVLNAGVDGIVLQISSSVDLDKVLKGVMTEHIQLYFQPFGDPSLLQESLEKFLQGKENPQEKLNGGILWSPTSALVKSGEGKPRFDLSSELLKYYQSYPNFNPFTIDFAQYAEAGGNGLQELTFGIGELIELVDGLEEFNISPKEVFQNFGILISVGSDYFAEIAKVKAGRKLISGLAGTFGLEIAPEDLDFLVRTSGFTKSLLDPDTNLIRQTFEAMSAILGGANSLWVQPIHRNANTELTRRIARNVSNILKDESHLDKVLDPSAGSFYLDNLQSQIEHEVFASVSRLEEKGGWFKAYENGELQKVIRMERERVQTALLDQSIVKVGVNKYQMSGEELVSKSNFDFSEKPLQLIGTRASFLIEKQNHVK